MQYIRAVTSRVTAKGHVAFSPHTSATVAAQKAQEIAAQQVRLLYSHGTSALAGAAINASVLTLALWDVTSHFRLLAWLGLMLGLTGARFGLTYWYQHAPHSEENLDHWRALFLVGSCASGLVWGATAVFLFPESSPMRQMFLVFTLGGMAAGAMGMMAPVRSAYVAFCVPTLVPILVRFSFAGDELSLAMSLLLAFFLVILLTTASHMHASITESLRLRCENLALIQNLSEAKEQAEHREARFRSLIENASDLITIINADGAMSYNSPSLERLLGYRPDEMLGEKVGHLLHPEDRQTTLALFARLLEEPSGAQLFECRVRHKDGRWRSFESFGQNLLQDAAVKSVVLNSRDITERKEMERLKDDLVSTVSHELRTPLTSLRGFAELMLAREFPPAKQRHFLSIILGEATRLTSLINDFLDLQRMESGRQQYTFETIDLPALLHESATVFAPTDGAHRLQLEVAESFPPVRIDADRIRQVLANLLSNAIKFSPRGGTVTVAAFLDGEQAVVKVTDEGLGIPAEGVARLFQKFYRVDREETRGIGGTGLGLSLVRQMVEAHGGRIWVESAVGVGSSFFFSLPLATPATTAREPETVLL
jgi:PAS domain S-box-containing protein